MHLTSGPWKLALDAAQSRFRDFFKVVVTRDDVADAAAAAATDTYAAVASLCRLLFVVVYPAAAFCFRWACVLLRRCYDEWIVRGGIKRACSAMYDWHSKRTRNELLVEGSLVAAAVAAYALRRWLQKNKFVLRAQFWMRRKRRKIQKSYRSFVGRIALVSQFLAYLFPHIMFILAAIAVKLLFPSFTKWLACETLTQVALSQLYPLLATAYYLTIIDDDNDNDRKQRQQPQDAGAGNDRAAAAKKLQQWLDYFMVFSSYHLLRSSVIAGMAQKWAPPWLAQLGSEIELAVFVWLLAVPYLSSSTGTGETDDDDDAQYYTKTPLDHAARMVGRAAKYVQHHVAALCREEVWQSYFMVLVQPFLALAVTLRLISSPTKDEISHALGELRTAILPAIMSSVPVIGPKIAVPYARTVLPLAKSNDAAVAAAASGAQQQQQNNANKNNLSLLRTSCQYWILQYLVTSLLQQSSLHWWLSWLPLGNLVIFIVWWYLSWPTTVTFLYGLVVEEFERLVLYAFHHFDDRTATANTEQQQQQQQQGDNKQEEAPVLTPRLVTAVGWLISRLPSADDLQQQSRDRKNDDSDDDDDDAQQLQQPNNGAKTGPTRSTDENNANNSDNNRESPSSRREHQQQQQQLLNDDGNHRHANGEGDDDGNDSEDEQRQEEEQDDGDNGEYEPEEDGEADAPPVADPEARRTRSSRRSRNPTPVY